MRCGLAIVSALLSCAAWCPASTLTDPFGQSQSNCNLSASSPYSTCDVIGNEMLYDIQEVAFSTSNGAATVSITLNSGAVQNVGGNLTLGPFNDSGITLIPGDIFFYNPTSVYDPSDPNTIQYLKYGIALTDHGSFTAGDLYSIGGGVGTETAQTALNGSSDYYRRDETVLMTGSGSPVSTGNITVSDNGSGGAKYVITVTVLSDTNLLSLESNGQLGLLFSSADCGNDVVQGLVGGITTTVEAPEPGPTILTLSGIALLVGGRLWRKWSARRG